MRKLKAPKDGKRVETGAVQFGTDSPGLFLQGHDAIMLAGSIRRVMTLLGPVPALAGDAFALQEIVRLIEEEVKQEQPVKTA